jgi:uncharacterized protein YndB with AHSA1/START domain
MKEMRQGHALKIERQFDARPEDVFAYWTKPELLARWYHPRSGWITEAETDVQVGGKYRISFGPPDGDRYVESGEYLWVDPPLRLSYTMTFEGGGECFKTIVDVEFIDSGGKTIVAISESGYPTPEVRDKHESGWGSFLNELESALTDGTSA